MRPHSALFIVAVCTSLSALGCSTNFCEDVYKDDHPNVDCDDLGAGGGSSTATTASMGTMTTTSTMTQSSSSTGVDPTCIPSEATWSPSESCGVFVKAGANGDGKPDTPFGTIADAVTMGGGKSIYVCEGTYAEGVQLAASENIFGGLVCDTWAYDASKRPVIASPPGAIGLHITGTGTHRIEDINIEADDANMPGGSSIGVFVHQATVDIARVDVTAGAGAMGEAGATEARVPTPVAANGGTSPDEGCMAAAVIAGPNGGQLMCGGIDVAGGAGGAGRNTSSGDSGQDGLPAEATGQGGKGKDTSGMPDCANGQSGRPGNPGAFGVGADASANGLLNESGYVGAAGGPGVGSGTPGQGGGGGGGANVCGGAGPAGGGGGAGGCGGNPGAGGKGGGGSFALVSIDAAITLESVNVTSGSGGNGGAGDAGQEGMDGGAKGTQGMPFGNSCDGGSGGKGGRGGAGGGGRGGPSVAIAYVGTAPTEGAGVMLTIAQEPAAGGDGGNGGPGNMGGTGATGILELRQAW